MVEWLVINFVTNEQKKDIRNTEKTAFFRMEDEALKKAYEQFKNNDKIIIYTNIKNVDELEGWLYVSYIDIFKWKAITHFTAIIERAGFDDKDELEKFLGKLYGIELEEDPFLYYIEFDYTPFPKHH